MINKIQMIHKKLKRNKKKLYFKKVIQIISQVIKKKAVNNNLNNYFKTVKNLKNN